jgi:hypothetical protein
VLAQCAQGLVSIASNVKINKQIITYNNICYNNNNNNNNKDILLGGYCSASPYLDKGRGSGDEKWLDSM